MSDKKNITASIIRLTTRLALSVAVLFAIVPPVLHFYYGVQYLHGHEAAEAELKARLVSQLVSQNPDIWEYETLRLTEIIFADDDEYIEIVNLDGAVVAMSGDDFFRGPVVVSSAPIYDSGVVVGEITINRSSLDIARVSLLVFLISGAISIGVYIAIKTLPLALLKKATDQAAFLASHDPLTKLPNRSLFNEWLVHSVADVSRQGASMAVLCLDLDHFKEVNDLLGHAAGDELLRKATERMSNSLRRNDILARLGGDEFAIIQKHVEQPSGVTQLSERLIAAFSKPFDISGNEAIVGLSVGIAIRSDLDDSDGQGLLRQADLALYRAKNDGRGVFRFFEEEMNDKLVARKKVEADLRMAISRNELQLYYQPQIDLSTNKIKGVEALIRWFHGEKGLIQPDEFIQLAEETGLIVPIGEWVIQEACRQAKDWPDLTFAVNVSPVQFRRGDLVETVKEALLAEGIEPHRLEIEITEGVLLSHTEETIECLNALQALGVRIAMDDFGTGYSSLSYLRRFPFDKIKIDKSFTTDLGACSDADIIIESVIRLGASMGMTSNAEGVETIEQAQMLRSQGCDEVQGFLFSKPMPSSSIEELLADWDWSESDVPKVDRPSKAS